MDTGSPTVAEVALALARYPGATRNITPIPWTALPLVAPWTVTPPVPGNVAQYRVDAQGNVELRGSVTGGPAAGPIGILPLSLAPLVPVAELVLSLAAGPVMQSSWIGVSPASDPLPGRVVLVASTVGPPVEVRLDGIRFSLF